MAGLFSAAPPAVAEGTPTTVAASTANPSRRADVDDSASTTIAETTMIPFLSAARCASRVKWFIVISLSHGTRPTIAVLLDEDIDDTFVLTRRCRLTG